LFLFLPIGFLAMASCSNNSSIFSSSFSNSAISSSFVADWSTEEAAALISENANRDGVGRSAEQLLSLAGYSGQEETTVERGLNLLYQAYQGAMPESLGQRAYGSFDSGDLSEVPPSLASAYSFLSSYGLFVPGSLKDDFAASSQMQVSELWLYLDRFHAFLGTSLKDDFHNTVNHDYLYDDPSHQGFARTDLWRDTEIASLTNLVDWTKGLVETLPEGSFNAENVGRFLASYGDFDERVAGNLCGLFPTLETIASCGDVSSLLTLDSSLALSQGVDPLFTGDGTDFSSLVTPSGRRSLSYLSAPLFTESSLVYPAHGESYEEEALALKNNFQALGFSSEEAERYGEAYCALKSELIISVEEKVASGKPLLTLLTPEPNTTYGPGAFNLFDHLVLTGYDMTNRSSANSVALVRNAPWGESLFDLFDSAHLDGLKAYLLRNEARLYPTCLPAEQALFFGKIAGFTVENYLKEGNYYRYVVPFIENNVLSFYTKTEDYQGNVTLAQDLLADIKAAFSARIDGESWLSEAGKAAAKRKLSAMKSKLFLHSDDGTESDVTPVSYVADDLYANLCTGARRQKMIRSLAGKLLSFAAFTDLSNQKLVANAFFVPYMNGIDITAGYLASQKGFLGKDAETLFAQLGWVMGHEITHGLDSNGIIYDENGTYSPSWWDSADREAYNARANTVVDFYDGYECLPGCPNVGKTTLSENIADLGGFRLMLDLGSSIESFDNAKLFLEGAKAFASTITSDGYLKTAVKTDVHSYGRVRVNRCFSSFADFHEAYDITEGDFMYAPASARPTMW